MEAVIAEEKYLRDSLQNPSEMAGDALEGQKRVTMDEIIAEEEAYPHDIFEDASKEEGEIIEGQPRTVVGEDMAGDETRPQDVLEEGEVIEEYTTSAARDDNGLFAPEGAYNAAAGDGQEIPAPEGHETTSSDNKETTTQTETDTSPEISPDTSPDGTTPAKALDTSPAQLPRTTYSPPFFAPTFIPGAPFYSLPSHPPPDLHITAGAIQFSNVTFAYNAADHPPALRNISFCVSPGENIAIVGLPNSGKSTLLKLLVGVLEGHGGRIQIDGVDTRDVSRASLLSQISVVPQSVCVLDASVVDNVRFGLNASRQRVEEACRVVGLHDRIMTLRNGYDSMLGTEGVECSRADLQKLGIARALLTDNRIALFDAALGAVDRRAECRILRYLRRWGEGRTVITVAHRLGTITLSDRIYVMWNGMLVESGKHAQLMARPGLYRRLWEHRDAV